MSTMYIHARKEQGKEQQKKVVRPCRRPETLRVRLPVLEWGLSEATEYADRIIRGEIRKGPSETLLWTNRKLFVAELT